MADVRPFRGVTFDPQRVDLPQVLCPPYDVISPAQQAAYYARDSHNFVRIVLNRAEGQARYTVAAAELRGWLAEGILRRAEAPALYVHRQTFDAPLESGLSGAVVRLGLIAAVRVEPWESGVMRPHEHTMPGPKEDRLKLLQATACDTEPIWVFHPDAEGEVRRRLAAFTAAEPWLRAEFQPEPDGDEIAPSETHELWSVSDPAQVEDLAGVASRVQLYMADGHHRYETALFHSQESNGDPEAASRFKVMLLTALEDPGFLVLPTHRLVRIPPGRSVGRMLAELRTLGWSSEQPGSLAQMLRRLAEPPVSGRVGFGLFSERRCSYLEGVISGPEVMAMAPALAEMDVALLHIGVLGPLLGVDPDPADGGRYLDYSRDPGEVARRVEAGEFDIGIFLRPPTTAQVRAVADAGENMPQKSTYFWPKPASGLIMVLQSPNEGL